MRIIFISQPVHVGEVLEVHLKAGIHSGNLLSVCVSHFTYIKISIMPMFVIIMFHLIIYLMCP